MAKKPSEKEFHRRVRTEKEFYLPLRASIEGKDPTGRAFKTNTVLFAINSSGSSFRLVHPVSIGEELKMTIDLPEGLAEDKNLKLIIKGKVAFIESSKDKNADHRVYIEFSRRYSIKSNEKHN